MNETFSEYVKRRDMQQAEIIGAPLKRSNSDTDLALFHLKEKHDQNFQTENYNLETILRKKRRFASRHQRLNKMLKKDKRRLTDYIISNNKYVKLFGNKRYKGKNPFLFVQDQKKNIDDRKLGLLPLPTKCQKKMKSTEEKKQLYELQRSIVMMRRFQYNKNYYLGNFKKGINNIDVITIQRWWRKMLKIITIQKWFRGYYTRKELKAMQKLNDFMNTFENTLLRLYARQCLHNLSNYVVVQKDITSLVYFSKKDLLVGSELKKKIILIQKFFRKLQSKKKRDKLLSKILKLHPKSKDFYLTKLAYSKPYLLNQLKKINEKWKEYSFLKKKLLTAKIPPQNFIKEIVCRLNGPTKLIQNWFKRHHLFLCNEKKKSNLLPKDKTWNYFTKTLIDEKIKEKAFIKPRLSVSEQLKNENLNTKHFYTSKVCYISKKRTIDTVRKIRFLQQKIRQTIVTKREDIIKNISANYYFSKIYVKEIITKLLEFSRIIKNVSRKNVCRKKISFIPYMSYTEGEINKIKHIQSAYRNMHYSDNKNIPKTYQYKRVCYLSKLRLQNNEAQIIVIQKMVHPKVKENIFIKENLVKNKPIVQKAYTEKRNIRNVENLLEKIQNSYRSHYIIKKYKSKRDNEKGKVISTHCKRNYTFITKKIVKNESEVNKVITIQNLYRNRYNYIVSRLLNNPDLEERKQYGTSLSQPILNNSKPQLQNSVYHTDANNDSLITKNLNELEKRKVTLYSLLQKNKKPIYDSYGCYVSKKRFNITYGYTYSFSYNLPVPKPSSLGTSINKMRLRDNTNEIVKIQRRFKLNNTYKNTIKKPNDDDVIRIGKIFGDNLQERGLLEEKLKSDGQNVSEQNQYLNNPSLCYYISKKRLINSGKEINLLQRSFLSHSSKSKNEKEILKSHMMQKSLKDNPQSVCYISKTRVSNITLQNFHQKFKIINSSDIKKTFLPCFVTKKYIAKRDKEVNLIQTRLRSFLSREKETIQRTTNLKSSKENLEKSWYISKDYKKLNKKHPISITDSFKTKKIYIETNDSINKIEKIQRKYKALHSETKRKSNFSSRLLIANENLDIPQSNILKLIPKLHEHDTFQTKIIRRKNRNFSFINLMSLFASKNAEEYVFNLLKYNDPKQQNSFTSPFYVNALERTLKFLKTNPKCGVKVQNAASKILGDIDNKTPMEIIASLDKNQMKQLQATNIYSTIEQDYIDYLTSFCQFDKKLSNENFILERLKQSKITNTNIFSFVRFLDEEFDNLVSGKYCMKCYQGIDSCHCTKKTSSGEEDDGFDLEIPNDEFTSKSLINHFEYDSTKVKGILIKRKPKIEESYEDPITHLIIRNENIKENKMIESKTIDSNSDRQAKDKKLNLDIRKILHTNINENSDKKNKVTIRNNSEQSEK